ncbi:HNH endonuclease protein [Rhizobium phage RHph_X66]|nr:HNH endonuclease protein [Rhizobium phage RHph_X66]
MAAIRSRYLIPNEDGTIQRANKADAKGVVDPSRGYSLVTVQVHKKSGRVYFNMTFRGFTKSVLVNRVIALAFLPNPNDLPQVNHVDGDKEHNYLRQPTPELRAKWGEFQLEWASGSENEKHAHRTGLKTGRGSANSNAKLTADQVVKIRAAANDNTPEELAKTYGVSRSTIINILNRKTWTHV